MALLKEFGKCDNLSKKRELYLFNNLSNQKNRDEIVQSHLKLVFGIAHKYCFLGESFSEDIIQEGIVSLIESIDSFKVNSGCRFSTFATFRISNKIKSFLRKSSFIYNFPEKK